MTTEIDYTHRRLSKKDHIVRCPKCLRRGEIAHYSDGSGRCFHKARRECYGLVITDGCYWKPGEVTP